MLRGISETVNARAFKLSHCVQHPWKLTSRDFWSTRNESKQVFKKNVFWENTMGISETVNARAFKPLRKCCGVSQKWWVLELSNLCHCVQHPWKLTSRDFWSTRNERKPLSKQKCVFEKMLWGISETVNARAFKPLPLYLAPLKTY